MPTNDTSRPVYIVDYLLTNQYYSVIYKHWGYCYSTLFIKNRVDCEL